MATYAPDRPIECPPAQKDWTKADMSESDVEKALTTVHLKVKTSLKEVFGGHVFTPVKLSTLTYDDEPIKLLRSHKAGWNGRDAKPAPAALLDAVEDAWLMLKESVPQSLMPKVLAGEDEFVSFCWAANGKRLEISFYDNDMSIVCDCILETANNKTVSEEKPLNRSQLTAWVRDFAAA